MPNTSSSQVSRRRWRGAVIFAVALSLVSQIGAHALHSYLVLDWAEFQYRAKRVNGFVDDITSETNSSQRYDAQTKRHVASSSTTYFVRVRLEDGSTETIATSSRRTSIGTHVTGYQNPNLTSDLRIEGLNQNIPPKFIVHLIAGLMVMFFAFPVAFIMAAKSVITPEFVPANATPSSGSGATVGRRQKTGT